MTNVIYGVVTKTILPGVSGETLGDSTAVFLM